MLLDFANANVDCFTPTRKSGTASEDVLTRENFAEAYSEISSWEGYAPTPLHDLKELATSLNVKSILYKDEGPRFGLGSFKALGGAYAAARVLQRAVSRRTGQNVTLENIKNGDYAEEVSNLTLVTATDGNHGRSVAWGAGNFGAKCRIYIHAEVSAGRAKAMKDLDATIVRIDGDYDASVDLARTDAAKNGWFVVSDTTWEGYIDPPRDVMSGYGVITHEIVDTLETPPTHIFLQAGVGGLPAAISASLRQHYGTDSPRVIVVEPIQAACLFASAQQGQAATVKVEQESIMAGLSCGKTSPMAWEILCEEVSHFLTIPDDLAAPAMRFLGQLTPPITAGESAVAGLAALVGAAQKPDLRERLALNQDARILLIGTEGATDPEIYKKIMAGA
ncbi:MAG: diaminopropionate ammonia-lyase [Rhodospirillaceae bacterium]|nr:MAG: diaminopropionate ammonia-lyase [Rhodospirillaceae bacterium]